MKMPDMPVCNSISLKQLLYIISLANWFHKEVSISTLRGLPRREASQIVDRLAQCKQDGYKNEAGDILYELGSDYEFHSVSYDGYRYPKYTYEIYRGEFSKMSSELSSFVLEDALAQSNRTDSQGQKCGVCGEPDIPYCIVLTDGWTVRIIFLCQQCKDTDERFGQEGIFPF